MIKKILISILKFTAPMMFISTASLASNSMNFQWEEELKQAIQEEQLDQVIPKELANCDGSGDGVKMWTEFMKGLSYIESSWDPKKNNPKDANGKPSRGLFQMTGGDTALGQNCFGTSDGQSEAPYDPIKNIKCAVKKMKELLTKGGGGSFGKGGSSQMGGSLKEDASKYWGPLKPGSEAHKKAENVINDVAGNCGTYGFFPSVAEGGGSSQSQPSAGSPRARSQRR